MFYGQNSNGGFAMRLNFIPTHVFRETTQVSFFDTGVKGSNGSDVVINHGNPISLPNDGDFVQYYGHRHQIDHNLVIEGSRIFTLINPHWDEPHHIIFLNRAKEHFKFLSEHIIDLSLRKNALLF